MDSLQKESVVNAVNNGIRRPVDVVIENQCYGAAVILIFAGMDAMGNLNRPPTVEFSSPQDFKEWVTRYLRLEGETQITPEEWWAARNAIVHTFGVYSRGHRGPEVRVLGWMVDSYPHVRFNPRVDPNLVLVDIPGLRDAFFVGMERFITEAFADPNRRDLTDQRIRELLMEFPVG